MAVALLALGVEHLCHDWSHLFESREAAGERAPLLERPEDIRAREAHMESLGYSAISQRTARRIFYAQVSAQGVAVAICTALGIYCRSVEEPYEFMLVLCALAALAVSLVVVNLLDEAFAQ